MKTWDEVADRLVIMETDNGYMVLDTDCDEYLCNEAGDNCFDTYTEAGLLAEMLIQTVLEHQD